MRLRILATAAVAAAGLTVTGLAPTAAKSAGAAPFSVDPILVKAPFAASRPAALPTPSECLGSFGQTCYTPVDLRSAYDIPDTIDGQPAGTGTTIMIVDAYGSPTAQSDLDSFSTTMGIPSTSLRVYTPVGMPDWSAPDDNEYGWAGETDLDVQWAHAIAPGAAIDLVVSPDAADSLDQAMRWGLAHLRPDTVSMSYGDPELDWLTDRDSRLVYAEDSAAYARAVTTGTTLFASSGDSWSDNNLGRSNFVTPADDPNVVAVGGTTLNDGLDPSLPDEFVWNDYDACPYGCSYGVFGGTGGAPSLTTGKQGSDVAYNASDYTSVLTYEGFHPDPADNGLYFSGGTSAGAPQWAALTADIDQAVGHDLGNIRPALPTWAARGGLTDVTSGDNASATYRWGYRASRGWDVPTGYGTPDVGNLIDLLAPLHGSGSHGHGSPWFSGPHTSPAHRGRFH